MSYIQDRIYYFSKAWFSTSEYGNVGEFNFLVGGLILFWICVWITKKEFLMNFKRLALLGTICLSLILPFTITQIEVRYVLPIKILIIFYLVVLRLERNQGRNVD